MQPIVKVKCLRPFLMLNGTMAQPQQIYEVPLDVATNAVALKNAQRLDVSAEEAARTPDPSPGEQPTTRDPVVRKRGK